MQHSSHFLHLSLLWVALTVLAGCSPASTAQISWRSTDGPGDLQIRAFLAAPDNPATLYAGVSGYGFHRSEDNGQSWQVFTAGLSMLPDLPIDPEALNIRTLLVSQQDSTLLFAGSEAGIHRSRDRGENWSPVLPADEVEDTDLLLGFFLVDALASIVIDDEERFFAGTKGGLFHLDAETDRWQPVEGMAGPEYRASAILVHPLDQRRLIVATFAEGIWESTDGGLGWQQIGQSFADADIWCNKLAWDSTGHLLVGTFGKGISRLEDGRWVSISQGLPTDARIWSLLTDESSSVIYASVADDRTYRSEEGGPWQPLSLAFGAYSLARQPQSGRLFLGTRGNGAWVSADTGSTWQRLTIRPLDHSALSVTKVVALADGRLIVGTENNGVFVRTAHGNWEESRGIALQHRKIYSLAQGQTHGENRPRIYAGTISGGVYASDDEGSTWTQLPIEGLPDESARKVMSLLIFPDTSGEIVYAGTFAGLYRLRPDATQWEEVRGLTGQTGRQVVVTALERGHDDAIYAAVNSQGIWRTQNGADWESVTANLLKDPAFVKNLRTMRTPSLGRLIHGAPRLFAANYNSIYTSGDGETWTQRISGPYSVAVDPVHPQVSYIAPVTTTVTADVITQTFPVLVSLNGGASWQVVDEEPGALSIPIAELVIQPGGNGQIFAATASGVYAGEVQLPLLWREINAWTLLFSPLLLLAAFLAFVYLTLTLPYDIPLPAAVRLLLFRRNALALALVQPSPLSSLQQLILAAGERLPVWSSQEMAALLDSENANASSAQLAAALDQLTRQFGLLTVDAEGRYRSAIPGLGRIFRWRVEANRGLLAKDVREENAIFQESRDFFRQAGFAVHARRDLLLLTPLQASWAELTEQADDAPLLARILAGGPPTVADVDESVRLAGAEYNGDPRGRLLFLVVPAAPDAPTRRSIRQHQQESGLSLVLISHAAIYQALGDGASPATLQIALRRHRGEISPAEISGPVLDPLDFFDRTELLVALRETLAGGQSLLISGPPQIGKSSLVWQAARSLDNFLLSYAEFTPGPAWEKQMLGDLLDGLVRDGSRKFPRTEWPFDPASVRSTVNSMADFAGTVHRMGEAITLAATRPRIALLVDGLNETTIDWWPQLLAACQQQTGLQIGLVGVVDSGFVLSDGGRRTTDGGLRSAVGGQQFAVGPFSLNAALEMAGAMADQAGIGLEGDAAQALVEASGGHPFLLRRLFGAAQLEAAVQARRAETSEAVINGENVAAGVHRHVASNPIYGRWWAALSPVEQRAVLAVGEGVGVVDPGVASRLVALGWLRPEGAGYGLAAGVFHVWLEWMGLL